MGVSGNLAAATFDQTTLQDTFFACDKQGEDGGLAIARTPSDNPSPRYYKSNITYLPRKVVKIKMKTLWAYTGKKEIVSAFCDSKPINIPMKTQTPMFRCYCSSSVCRVIGTS